MNEVLHSVTNRGKGFATVCFPSRTSFVPDTNASANSLRAFLGFNRVDTDYFVVAALRLVHAYPDLLCRFGETQRSYALQLHAPPPPQTSPVQLVAEGTKAPFVRRAPQEWPPVFDTSVARVDGTTVLVSQGATAVQAACAERDNTLKVLWPAGCGIGGVLRSDQPWADVGEITIRAEPYGYPYALLVQELELRDDVQDVLQAASAWESFLNTVGNPRKLAILLTALGLTNRAVYG